MRKFLAAIAAACLVLVLSGPTAMNVFATPQKAPASTLKGVTRDASPVVPVAEPYCARRYFLCRDRWGANWRFERCMRAAACWDNYLRYRIETAPAIHGCGGWREACAQRWGFRTPDYFGCLRYHGCD